MTYEELVRAVGPGFHPATPVGNYQSKLYDNGMTVREAEKVWLNAHNSNRAYHRAWAVFLAEGWIKEA